MIPTNKIRKIQFVKQHLTGKLTRMEIAQKLVEAIPEMKIETAYNTVLWTVSMVQSMTGKPAKYKKEK